MNQTVLISGATGLLGKALAIKLLLDGYQLAVVGRSSEERFRQRFELPCKYVQWKDLNSLSAPDAVIHLAGESIADGRWNESKKKRILESRVSTTKQLVEYCNQLEKPPKVFVSTSAIGFYGDCSSDWLSEASSVGSTFLAEVCKKWEGPTDQLNESTRKVIFRVGIVLSEKGGALKEMASIFSRKVGSSLSSGRQWMSWIHLDDVVKAYITALNEPKLQGTYNLVSPEPAQNQTFSKALAQILDVPLLPAAPGFVLKLGLGEKSDLLLESQRVSSHKLQEMGFEFNHRSLDSALKDLLGWQAGYPNRKVFEKLQWVSTSLEQTFEFFSSTKNLEKITPSTLSFHVLKQSTEKIEAGTLIDYRLKIHGIPAKWQTQITEWNPPHKFTDFQNKGPYNYWHHQHLFYSVQGGTLIIDRVEYEVPFGLLGRMTAGGFVSSDVEKIFNFRTSTLSDLLQTNDTPPGVKQ